MPSRGRIYPRFRGELVEAAAVARGMLEGEVEHTRVPRIPLDVLCQQIVAMASVEELQIDSLHALVRRAYPYRELTREQLENVLDLLAGRYPSDEFAELRPRIVWERTTGALRAREGAQRIAIANAGTIPDRGLYGVFLVDGGGRVGELDEEMVHEAREGQVFLLGASAWRIEQIERDRVIVSPAPGQPAQVPFWKGEQAGRPVELGRAVGRLQRELAALDDESAMQRLTGLHACDERAARTLVEYLREQETATGVLPSDRTIVVERFRDEIGDWRLCVLSPFGARVHAPWGLALRALLREQHGIETHALWSDDGIILHLPDADSLPPDELVAIDPDRIEDLVVGELGGSSLFGARFRESAARALLIPRRRPGQRTPLWQQRLRAQSLLAVAERYGSFPILLETYRELLADHFDLGRAARAARRPARRHAPARRRRVADRVAVRRLAQLRVRRAVPVRGRRARGRAARRGAHARSRPPARAGGLGRAARPARRRRARAGRARARQRAPRRPRRAARPAAPRGRPGRGRAAGAPAGRRGGGRRRPARRPPRAARAHRRRGPPDRRRGHGPLPRRARRDAARRHSRSLPRGRARRPALARAPLRALARAVPGCRRSPTATTSSRRSPSASSRRSSARACSCAARCAPAAAGASGATSRCCAASAARRSRACGARSRRSSSPRWRASCRPGTASGARAAAASTGCARCSSRSSACRSRPRSGSARCCRCAWTTGPSCSTSCARAARSCGSAPTPGASRSPSARTPRCSGRPPGQAPPPADPASEAVRAALAGARHLAELVLGDRAARGRGHRGAVAARGLGRGHERRLGATAAHAPGGGAAHARAARRHAPAHAPPPAAARRGARALGARPLRCCAAPIEEADRRRALAELLLERHGVLVRAAIVVRGRPRRACGPAPGARRARDARGLAPRLPRRRPRRRAARAAGCDRAPARGARARRRTPAPSRSPRAIRRIRTASPCAGRRARRAAPRARRARPSCCATASRSRSSSAEHARCSRCSRSSPRDWAAVAEALADGRRCEGRVGSLQLERIDGEAAHRDAGGDGVHGRRIRRGPEAPDAAREALALPEGHTLELAALRMAPLVGHRVAALGPGYQAPHGLAAGARRPRARSRSRRAASICSLAFDNGRILHSHLRMTGAWHVYAEGQPWARSPAERLAGAERERNLRRAVRRAGARAARSRRASPSTPPCAASGPICSTTTRRSTSPSSVRARARRGTRPIGEVLLDQTRRRRHRQRRALRGAACPARRPVGPARRRSRDETLSGAASSSRGACCRPACAREAPCRGRSTARRICPRCGAAVRRRGQGDEARTRALVRRLPAFAKRLIQSKSPAARNQH